MDENYLDNLLNEISLDKELDYKIEDELDSQMRKEKQERQAQGELSEEESFNLRLEQEASNVEAPNDLHFSEEQMEELDALDHLADLDIGDLDFGDLDFDDVDVTKLDDLDDDDNFDELLKDFEGDLEIEDFFDRGDSKGDTKKESLEDEKPEHVSEDKLDSNQEEELPKEDLNEDSFNANAFLDSLLYETDQEEAEKDPVKDLDEEETSVDKEQQEPEEKDAGLSDEEDLSGNTLEDLFMSEEEPKDEGSLEEIPDLDDLLKMDEKEEKKDTALESGDAKAGLAGEEIDDLDDLLSMLDLEEGGSLDTASASEKAVPDEGEDAPALQDDVEPLEETQEKKKRTFMQILFGDPDEEDELSIEELEAIEAKKAEKKAAKAAKKEAAKAAKMEKEENDKAKKALEDEKKKRQEEQKNRVRAEKKAKRKAEEEAEAANAGPEKKLNKPMVVFVFTLFLGGLLVFYFGTNNFNYTQAIEKAANYFANQKYRRAYDEIVGVKVKEEDKALKDRIYTVMYVERLYEAYNNNVSIGNEEKALDSLLRGVTKYHEHYEEAVELGVSDDIDYAFQQIKETLQSRYGISEEQALDINAMENVQYVQTVGMYAAGVETGAGTENPDEDVSSEDRQEDNSAQPDTALSTEEQIKD